MLNYAHRGASEYAPENTLSSFYLGLLQGANAIETDVQRTKDGVLVLFHDDTLDRVSDGHGKVCEYTLQELKELKIRGNVTTNFYDKIVTFREFLECFAKYDINFAIELKTAGLEADVLAMAEEFGIMVKTTFTSFEFEYIRNIKAINKEARIGWLIDCPEEDDIKELLHIGGEEIAPKAQNISAQLIAKWRNEGLGVRAWGVYNVALMKDMCKLGVDGMTVNFPDRLYQYLNSN